MDETKKTQKMNERAFSFIRINQRSAKPRQRGLTEIRGPYYTAMGTRCLADIMETIGDYVDGLKFAGGSFVLMPRTRVREINDLAHMHGAYVSTGGFIEHILTHESPAMVERYLGECQALGFDYVELSTGFISLPVDDLTALVKAVSRAGLKPKPELGIQFGAGGTTSSGELAAEGTRDVRWLIVQAKRCRDAGAPVIMIESEGITESVTTWRTDVVAAIMDELGPEQVMFEAADPDVFEWYIKNYGPEVNLFVDHSQAVQLACLRAGLWGTKSSWGRIACYKPAPVGEP
jgi:phosphosulfolactate synthase (CoM biosynthesis protein A)